MREARVFQQNVLAGILRENADGSYEFHYHPQYQGTPISLTMPVRPQAYSYERFPPFFEGLLPEGFMLNALLRKSKLDADDFLGQLLRVGGDLVGSVTVKPVE